MLIKKFRAAFFIFLTTFIAASALQSSSVSATTCQTSISTIISQVQALESSVQGNLPDALQDTLLSPLLTIANELNSAQRGQYEQLNAAQNSIATFRNTVTNLIGYNQGAFDYELKQWINTANQLSTSLTNAYQTCTTVTATAYWIAQTSKWL